MSKTRSWYCPRWCNVFESSMYRDDDPPECGACGSRMVTDPSLFDDAHEQREIAAIENIEAERRK